MSLVVLARNQEHVVVIVEIVQIFWLTITINMYKLKLLAVTREIVSELN